MSGNITIGAMSPYSGSYSVTPGSSAQTLYTAGKYLSGNITVGASQGFRMTSGSLAASGNSCTISVGFVPRMVALTVRRNGTSNTFITVYNATTGVCWQSNDSGGYHTYTSATVSGTSITFYFKTNANGNMATTGTINWIATGY